MNFLTIAQKRLDGAGNFGQVDCASAIAFVGIGTPFLKMPKASFQMPFFVAFPLWSATRGHRKMRRILETVVPTLRSWPPVIWNSLVAGNNHLKEAIMAHKHQNPHTHAQKPLTIEEIAAISEELYSGLVELICSLQVFHPLQKAALYDENYESLHTLEMLHNSLLEKSEELDAKAHELRRAVDPDIFAQVYMRRVVKILDEQQEDVKIHRAGKVQ